MTDIRKDQSESSDISDSPHTRLVPQLRFKGFTGSWEQHKFRDIFSYRRPDHILTPDSAIYSKGKYPVLTANKAFTLGFTDNQNHVDFNVPCLIFDDFTMQAKYVNYPFSVRSSAIKVLRTNKEYDLYFAYELLSAYHFPELGHARHYISYVQSRQIYVPSLKEQKKISLFLVKLDSLIAAAVRQRDLLKRQKQGYLQKMFPRQGENKPKLHFKGFTGSWEQRELGSLLTINTGSHNTEEGSSTGKYPLYVRSNQKLYLNTFDYDEEAILVPGDGRIGEIFHYVNGPYALHQRVYRLSNFKHMNAHFLLYLLEARFKKHALRVNAQGTVPSLRHDSFAKWNVKVPDDSEQKEIASFFTQIDSLIAAAERKINLLKELKQGYLQQMFI